MYVLSTSADATISTCLNLAYRHTLLFSKKWKCFQGSSKNLNLTPSHYLYVVPRQTDTRTRSMMPAMFHVRQILEHAQ